MNFVNIRGPKRTGKITANAVTLQLLLPANVHRVECRFKNIDGTNPAYLSNGKIEVMDVTGAAVTIAATTVTTVTTTIVGDVLLIGTEQMLVTAVVTTTATVTRAYAGTTATVHGSGDTIWISRTHSATYADSGWQIKSGIELIDLSSNDAWYVISTGGNADVEYLVVTK